MKQLRLLLTVCLLTVIAALALPIHSLARSYPNTHTTTIFVHGYGSNYHAEESMTHYLLNHGASNSIIRANVTKNGHVTFIGHQPRHAKNPIIEMNYDASYGPKHSMRENNYPNQVKAVVKAVQHQYGVKKVNFVGHSMGNMIIAQYMNDNINDHTLPKISHFAMLAGGNMAPYSKTMTSHLKHQLPAGLHVLNIYSDYRHGSDGRVSNKDSKAWRAIFGKAASYHEVRLTGLKHSQLHESQHVDQLLIKFLF